jgi:hypothetical protein
MQSSDYRDTGLPTTLVDLITRHWSEGIASLQHRRPPLYVATIYTNTDAVTTLPLLLMASSTNTAQGTTL